MHLSIRCRIAYTDSRGKDILESYNTRTFSQIIMSQLPRLQAPGPITLDTGLIVNGALTHTDKYKKPTFTFITGDEKFAVQYYHDWTAPSELDNVDAYMAEPDRAEALWDDERQQYTLLCRDPRVGPGGLYLYGWLHHTKSEQVKARIATQARYKEVHNLKEQLAVQENISEEGLDEYRQLQLKYEKTRLKSAIDRHVNKLRQERANADATNRVVLVRKRAESQNLWRQSIAEEGPWTDQEIWEITDSESRGDVERVKEMVAWRKAQKGGS